MGCTSSTESAEKISSKNGEKTLSSSGVPSTLESRHDQEKRAAAESSSTPSTLLELGKFRIRYACSSRKGRDPEDASKPNQDAYSVHDKFCNEKSDAFFGVYDGHGPTGDACSGFVKQRLPDLVSEKIRQQDEFILTTDQIHASLHGAHTQCNDELHAAKHIDDSSSGTTSITVYIQGAMERITISNVGDSRAVLGTKTTTADGGKTVLRAVPLSKDQTPHRTDEAQRCIRSGARIMSFGQINPVSDDDSETEDPPRVWAQDGKYPGTAFTRSIGDAVAERLGVYAEPEMLSLRISPKELIIVLASDGIFDVMSNQQVIDMCYRYYDQDPAQACKDVIDCSHNEWLKAEECTEDDPRASYDDMTMTCIFICHESDAKADEVGDGEGVVLPTTPATDTSKPPEPAKASPQHQRRKRIRQKTLHHLDDMQSSDCVGENEK